MNADPHTLAAEQLRDLRRAHDQLAEFIAELHRHDLRSAFRTHELQAQLARFES